MAVEGGVPCGGWFPRVGVATAGGVVSNRKREDFGGVYFPVCISEPLKSAIYIR